MATATPITPQSIGHRLITIQEVKQKLGLRSSATIYSWISERGFPKPRTVTGRCSRWLLSEVDLFIEDMPTSELGKRKAA